MPTDLLKQIFGQIWKNHDLPIISISDISNMNCCSLNQQEIPAKDAIGATDVIWIKGL